MTTKEAFTNLKQEIAVFHGTVRYIFSRKAAKGLPKMDKGRTVTVNFSDKESADNIAEKLRE